ncbi:PIG-L deacetylase family protein [Haloferula sargassicola]|uniref:PIG-L family deacetylase n=1 Tax=Haloferula sargassicola TaxID=490096 RepID=A0ABP9UNP3_9BACT
MTFRNASATLFIPDSQAEAGALKRITHLGIGAHQDDLEFMAFHGILECYRSKTKWFGGVTCTDGAGSSRAGPYAHFSDEEMVAARRAEQDQAAQIGHYGVMIQLGHPSSVVKSPNDPSLRQDLQAILSTTRPEVVYTHNPADKHQAHIGVVIAALQAMRALPPADRPQRVIGCEVWRNLDWLDDADKVLMDVSGHDELAAALNGTFDSQIAGGKRYDLATLGRRSANATFFNSHATDAATQLIYGMDLTPLVTDETLSITDYVGAQIEKFQTDVKHHLARRLGEA